MKCAQVPCTRSSGGVIKSWQMSHFPRCCSVAVVAVVVVSSSGCSKGSDASPTSAEVSSASTITTSASSAATRDSTVSTDDPSGSTLTKAICAGDGEVRSLGTIKSPEISEASGMVASRLNRDLMWIHNDSGDKPRIYAVDRDGAIRSIVSLTGAKSIDWEDIAASSDSTGGAFIYVGDIGDNRSRRDHVSVYRIDEPALGDVTGRGDPKQLAVPAVRFDFKYPDGPRDAEAMFVERVGDEEWVYIIDKNWKLSGESRLYRGSVSGRPSSRPVELESLGTITFPAGTLVTAADLSPDGSAIAVRAYGSEWLFGRTAGESIAEALTGSGCEGPAIAEAQGEAIAFAGDGSTYLTIAEGAQPTLHEVAVAD